MGTSDDYLTYVTDIIAPFYPITTRRMFGGVGIFCEAGMFALISSEDVLYFKVDAENKPSYEAAEAGQFHHMPYFEIPADVLEADAAELKQWVDASLAVAARAAAKKSKKKKK